MHNQISKQLVLRLRQQSVRDLAWSLWGPALLIHPAPYSEESKNQYDKSLNTACFHAEYFPLDLVWLQKLDQQPQALLDYLQQKNTRLLGTYFEALWQFYFSYHPSFQKCLCNLQVNDSTRTVGEFDVLVTNNQGQNFHIELACKFYLEWQDNQQEDLWIGPNCGDRLDIKYDKTSTHQLPLLKTELGQKKCNQQSFNSTTAQQLAIWRGASFHRHQWFRVNQLESDLALKEWKLDDNVLWFIADKNLWLSPVTQERGVLKTYAQISQLILDHFQCSNSHNKYYALMLIALVFDDKNQQWQQQQQFFITPNNWPYGKLADSALTPLRPCKPPL